MDAAAREGWSTAELVDAIDQLHGLMLASHSQLLDLVADYDRREAWREDGPPPWPTGWWPCWLSLLDVEHMFEYDQCALEVGHDGLLTKSHEREVE